MIRCTINDCERMSVSDRVCPGHHEFHWHGGTHLTPNGTLQERHRKSQAYLCNEHYAQAEREWDGYRTGVMT